MKSILVVVALAACGKSDKPAAESKAGSDSPVAGSNRPVVERSAKEAVAPKLALDVPVFADDPMAPGDVFRPGMPVVIVTKAGITFQGKALVALADGVVDAADLSDGGVTRLEKLVSGLQAKSVYVALEKSVPYRTMHEVWTALGAAGVEHTAFVFKVGENFRVVPLGLHSKTPPPGTDGVLTFTADKIVRWTLSGTAGTRAKPSGTWKYPDKFAVIYKTLALEAGDEGSVAGGPPLILQFPDSFTVERAAGIARTLDAFVSPLLGRTSP